MAFTYKRTYTGPIKLAVFDWAGTTLDFGCCAPAAVFIEGFKRRGVDVTMAQARGPMGMEKRAHIRTMGEMEPIAAQWQAQHGRPMSEADIDAIYEDFVPLLLDVLDDYSTLIPGTVETMTALREKGILIAGTTGYFPEAMARCAAAAAPQGYAPDFSISANQVQAGRPAPWLIYECMKQLDVYPPQAVVKVGDTKADIEAGLNAGVWTIGVAASGNEVGLSQAEFDVLDEAERGRLVAAASERLGRAGAHIVVEGIWDVPDAVAHIEERLAVGEAP